MRRPTGILPGGNVFQFPPPAVEASELSVVGGGAGEARGPGATGEAAAIATGVGAVVDFVVGPFQIGGFFATTIAGVGDGEGFLFFASFPPLGVAVGFDGVGDTTATFGGSSV